MPLVSQFSSVHAKAPAPPVELMAILSNIKSGRWQGPVEALRKLSGKAYDEAKKRLPGFTATGIFERKNDESFVEHSGFVQVDVDGKDNTELNYGQMWSRVKECPHVYAAFRSPSGRGIKALVRCPADKALHAGSYKAAAQWLQDKGINVDTRVCALSQLCFCSFDPHLYVNSKAVPVIPLPVEETEHALVEYEETRTKEEILAACEAAWPDVFPDLWAGDYEAHKENHSDADHWLIGMLRDNCHSNELVAELFAESGMCRFDKKWSGRVRDYVFKSLESSSAVQALSLFTTVEVEDDPEPPKKRKHKGWSWTTAAEIGEWKEEENNYIIKHLLHEGTTSCVFGAPGSGKTFLVFSMCAAIASGTDWQGYKVKQGGVLYFGLEGRAGVKKRIQAMKKEGRLDDVSSPLFAQIEVGADSLNLLSDEHVIKVVETVKAFEAESGQKCKVIVVDTLARATPGGDENSTKDMGLVMVNAQLIADKTGCCVLVIHHSGKDASRGARGSTALTGGFDSIFEVLRMEDDPATRMFVINKVRDEADAGRIYFRLRIIELGVDSDGEKVTSCLTEFLTGDDIPVKREPGEVDEDHLVSCIPAEGISTTALVKLAGGTRTGLNGQLGRMDGRTVRKGEGGKWFPLFNNLDDEDFDPTAEL